MDGDVEMQIDGRWGKICIGGGRIQEKLVAMVTCRYLGYEGDAYLIKPPWQRFTRDAWMDLRSCDGTEASVTECVGTFDRYICPYERKLAVNCNKAPCPGNCSCSGEAVNEIRCRKQDILPQELIFIPYYTEKVHIHGMDLSMLKRIMENPANSKKRLNILLLDVGAHLARLNVARRDITTESALTLARTGNFEASETQKTICPKHRDALGIQWKPGVKCQHPLSQASKMRQSIKVSREVWQFWNVLVPVGSAICKKCRVAQSLGVRIHRSPKDKEGEFSDAGITRIPKGTFTSLYSLIYLYLPWNRVESLSSIEDGAFREKGYGMFYVYATARNDFQAQSKPTQRNDVLALHLGISATHRKEKRLTILTYTNTNAYRRSLTAVTALRRNISATHRKEKLLPSLKNTKADRSPPAPLFPALSAQLTAKKKLLPNLKHNCRSLTAVTAFHR
ncbi:predicted protein [Nematostella vectensis]|uniref:SRCR domain-containing protein n=1 Tax=Nematostella vectensis TaxID=45351 RepID=A7RS28_NEMVE|nr:predicted protein [Nematostella vectensis]|eukprot:XP_001637796.1 predicted protein [Nematostella vectensis]